ncbi:disulfide oxidoreductase [Gottfriedia acidiceleris]|jgi:disulfide bond formation protein DsbB|uniref:disulfide oxidoreductase n=1 Tax=Bacillaceae TaxID=186817 RepID=UPI000BED6526|nr:MULTISPECIES: disulfide oxidoreductase [unclassified Bacillus (in: firmicutes)]PEC49935.1 disulfide bond formation protein B [Bacillus sp. AFS096315]PET69980.1 disulfide bond formation protein B [Bacillus sp. AFS001701]PFM79391.1 disulfide bond formation protein B [Bacillus sp. AFS077874]
MKKQQSILFFTWIVSIIATLGSLSFSVINHWTPCSLCWYQRIFMYPIVFILGIAFYKNKIKDVIYVLPLSLIGMCISIYHILIQKVPALKETATQCGPVPCTGDYLNWFGFITIPMLAFVAFLLINICCITLLRKSN